MLEPEVERAAAPVQHGVEDRAGRLVRDPERQLLVHVERGTRQDGLLGEGGDDRAGSRESPATRAF